MDPTGGRPSRMGASGRSAERAHVDGSRAIGSGRAPGMRSSSASAARIASACWRGVSPFTYSSR